MISESTTPTCDDAGWFVSSFSNGNASCVEVKFAKQGIILVRDSKDGRDSPPIISAFSNSWKVLLNMCSHRA